MWENGLQLEKILSQLSKSSSNCPSKFTLKCERLFFLAVVEIGEKGSKKKKERIMLNRKVGFLYLSPPKPKLAH